MHVSTQKAGYTFTSQSITTGTSTDNTATCGNRWPVDFAASNPSAPPPTPPSNPGTTNVTTSSLRWTWTDNSSDETGFRVYADPGSCPPMTLRTTTSANTTYWDYNSLTANCLYCLQVAATNSQGDSAKTDCISKYTLAGPPSYGNNVSCNKSTNVWYPKDTVFAFSNPAGFGTCGQYRVSKFKYVWNSSSAHTWTGSESDWSSGDLSHSPSGTGSYYLHLISYNAEGVPSATGIDLGPYKLDTDLPSTPVVTDEGAKQSKTNKLTAQWTSSDAASGLCEYQYAIGTQPSDPGSGYVVSWKSAGTSTGATEAGLSLQYGKVYYWYVKSRDCAGNWSQVGVSDGIAVVSSVSGSVTAVKLLPNDAPVALTSVAVSALFDDALYVQDELGKTGIRVQTDVLPPGVVPGRLVDIGGVMSTNEHYERLILGCVHSTDYLLPVGPVGIGVSSLGGTHWYYNESTGVGQRGIQDGIGLNNIGMLVRTWGRVTSTGDPIAGVPSQTVVIADGSGASVYVIYPLGTELPGVNTFVTVTGISSCVRDQQSKVRRLLRAMPSPQ